MTAQATGDKALAKIKVKDLASAVEIRSGGTIAKASFGRLVDSLVLAGIADDVTSLPTTEADFINKDAQINSFKTKGTRDGLPDFVNSTIAAWTLGSVSVKVALLENGGTPFGLAADQIGSVSGSGGEDRVKLSKLNDPAQLAQLIIDEEIELGDLEIRVF